MGIHMEILVSLFMTPLSSLVPRFIVGCFVYCTHCCLGLSCVYSLIKYFWVGTLNLRLWNFCIVAEQPTTKWITLRWPGEAKIWWTTLFTSVILPFVPLLMMRKSSLYTGSLPSSRPHRHPRRESILWCLERLYPWSISSPDPEPSPLPTWLQHRI